MTSTEKVYAALEYAQTSTDEELEEALPLGLPAAMLRASLALIAGQVPQDPQELDQFLGQIADFCLSLRSDAEE